MTWPPDATRAEILRLLEINAHIYTEWVITRAETEAILGLLGWQAPGPLTVGTYEGWKGSD